MLDLTIPLIVTNLLRDLKDEHFKIFFSKNAPKTMVELRLQAKKYINAKDVLQIIDEMNLTDLNLEGTNT